MATPAASSGMIRFGAFEADLRSGELRKDGVRVKLEGQPFQVLAVLLDRPGNLVTREELRKQLWPDETFVDFEQGINAAVKRLRLALEDSADTPRFIETLPRRGYRFIGQIENSAKSPLPDSDGAQAEAISAIGKAVPGIALGTTQRVPTVALRVLIGFAASVLVLLVVVAFNPSGVRDRLLGQPRAGEITSIAVLPLKNLTGDPAQEYFVDGMTDALTTELGKISALKVTSVTSALAFRDTKKPLPEIAQALGVDAVLEGAVARNGDQISIRARVIHCPKEHLIWSQEYERNLGDMPKLQSEIALVVADEIKVKLLTQEQARLAQARPVNPRAYEAYITGRALQARRNPEDMRRAAQYFQRALELDPTYALAYVGIVDCYGIGGGRQMGVPIKEADARMKEAARKVIELAGSSAAAHYALAMIKWHEWDFPTAEKEFLRALEMDPRDVQVRQQYSHYLLSMRRWAEARREIELALVLDPLSPMLTADLAFPALFSGKDPEFVIKQCQRALTMQKDYMYAQQILAGLYWRQGRHQEAFALGYPAFQPDRRRHLMEVYERAGVKAMYRWWIHDAEQRNPTGEFYSRSAQVAQLYLQVGEKDKALLWFERAYQEHEPWLPMDLNQLPGSVRSDPRFQDLLRRIGLPQ